MTPTDPRPLPFAVFDEFGKPADDRVQDHIYAALSEAIGDSQPVAWQERQARRINKATGDVTEWSGWHECKPRKLTEPLAYTDPDEMIPREWRALYTSTHHAIEESARCLERASNDFIAMGNEQPEGEDRDTTYGLADSYRMAANEVRLQIPAYRAMKERNLAKVKEWQRKLLAGEETTMPEVEQWDAAIAAHPSTDQNHSG